jgi:hypothetical protein
MLSLFVRIQTTYGAATNLKNKLHVDDTRGVVTGNAFSMRTAGNTLNFRSALRVNGVFDGICLMASVCSGSRRVHL